MIMVIKLNVYFVKIKSNKKIFSIKEYQEYENKFIKSFININGYLHEKNGKPYLVNSNIKLSISNNNKIILIATHNKNIGVDLQLIKKNTKFSVNKIREISMLEALYKTLNFSKISVKKIYVNKKNIILIKNKKFILYSNRIKDYIISICYEI